MGAHVRLQAGERVGGGLDAGGRVGPRVPEPRDAGGGGGEEHAGGQRRRDRPAPRPRAPREHGRDAAHEGRRHEERGVPPHRARRTVSLDVVRPVDDECDEGAIPKVALSVAHRAEYGRAVSSWVAPLGPTGLLAVAAPAWLWLAHRLSAPVAKVGGRGLGLVAGAVSAIALTVLAVRVLGGIGLLGPLPLLLVLGLAVTFSARLGQAPPPLGLAWLRTPWLLPLALVGAAAGGLVVLAAVWLPVWQWDSLGYHLPFVNFALQRGVLADVPLDAHYLGTYPHAIELFFTAFRALLPDDRLVELAHVPLALLGGLAVATLARTVGAGRRLALAAGAVWLTLPAVYVQVPTNYVDVGSAALYLAATALVLAPVASPQVLAAGLALGLFLGSKPNAPVGTALLGVVLAVRVGRALRGTGDALERRRLGRALVVALVAVLVLGAETFVVNVVRHGNPNWPVEMKLGPLVLPGPVPVSQILGSGAAAPRAHGPLLVRVLTSWTSLSGPPVFDMRLGGLGPAFLLALPLAAWEAVRARRLAWLVPALGALASPDPSVARYVLAFPALVLALAATRLQALGPKAVRSGLVAAAAFGAYGVVYVAPGLTGEGPPLFAYPALDLPAREQAVGADGAPMPLRDAVNALPEGRTTAFDRSLDLPYLAWPTDLSRHAVFLPSGLDDEAARRLLVDRRVGLLVAERGSVFERVALADPGHFEARFACKSAPCVVYTVRR